MTKLNASGNGAIYSTYLGGDGNEWGLGIVINGMGNAFITGYTSSSNFPMMNPYNSNFGGTSVFVSQINLTGNGLIFSTYIGIGWGWGIDIDLTGNVYITGQTSSSSYPILNSYQTHQGSEDVFVTKLNSSGNGLLYSTFLGGNGIDWGYDIAVDAGCVGNCVRLLQYNILSSNIPHRLTNCC